MAPTHRPLAGFAPRLLSALVDGVVLQVGALLLMLAAGLDPLEQFELRTAGGFGVTVRPGGLGQLLAIPYFTVLHGGFSGRSPGNRVAGVRVVALRTGRRLTPGAAAVRVLASIVSQAVFMLGFLWMLWDRRSQTWHDKAARSLVLVDRR